MDLVTEVFGHGCSWPLLFHNRCLFVSLGCRVHDDASRLLSPCMVPRRLCSNIEVNFQASARSSSCRLLRVSIVMPSYEAHYTTELGKVDSFARPSVAHKPGTPRAV